MLNSKELCICYKKIFVFICIFHNDVSLSKTSLFTVKIYFIILCSENIYIYVSQ